MEEKIVSPVTSEFSIDSVFKQIFLTFFRHPFVFLGITLLPILLLFTLPFFFRIKPILISLLAAFITQISRAVAAYAVCESLRGNKPSILRSLSKGFSRFFPVMCLSFLTALGIGLGSLLFLIPGIILSCMWIAAIPACIVEKREAVDSMTRSSDLATGYKLRIFSLLLLFGIIYQISTKFIPDLIFKGVYTHLFSSSFLSINSVLTVTILLTGLFFAFLQSLDAIMSAVIYFNLRKAKEGVDLEEISKVFD